MTLVATRNRDAHIGNQALHGGHILQARHVCQYHGLGREQGGTQLWQCGVFGAGDDDLAMQRPAAANQKLVHAVRISEKFGSNRALALIP